MVQNQNMKKIISIIIFCVITSSLIAQTRTIIDFNRDWKFYLGNDSLASEENYNDANWRKLNLPHDWSIESNFINNAPATTQGGALPGGIGWYRKTFTLPASSKNKIIAIEFDGVYRNSEVWINGHYLGKRPNGYVNFSYELTEYLNQFPQKNSIAVKVDNSQQPNSRWYSGSGIYRDVKLVTHSNIHFVKEDYFVTSKINKDVQEVIVNSTIVNKSYIKKNYHLVYEVFDKNGQKLMPEYNYNKTQKNVLHIGTNKFLFSYNFKNLKQWSVDKPNIYTLKTILFVDDKIEDELTTTFGIRSINFDKDKGFFLNNQSVKIKGVCQHHDLGALGAAFNKHAAKRQLLILKNMGCNAIRFSHNPPAKQLLDLCDEMGFLVIDEAFDMWNKKKNKYDYHSDFSEWHKKDLEAMILRDRNHPSIIMWSVGNEIREQFDSSGITITKELVDIVKNLDNTRPVTSAMTETKPKYNFIAKSNALDVFGFNYREYDYDSLPIRFPNQKFLGTEIASAVTTRGVYYFPSDSIRTWPPDYKHQDTFDGGNADYTGPAFDNTKAYWGCTHETAWLAVKNRPFIAGGFIWSGFDYIGEPLPYPKFPARSSYFGVIDLAGFPKDPYYMYQSEWSDKPVLHLFPHWNWNKGDIVDAWAYFNNADEVELFINDKSLGKKRKTDSSLHVLWRVPYEAGILKAVSTKNNKVVLTTQIKTASTPAKIELTADKKLLKADGNDLSFITVKILDSEGNLVPNANNKIEFNVLGNGFLTGTDNGYQADTISLKNNSRNVWKGKAIAIIQTTLKKGNITVIAKSDGLPNAQIFIKTY